MFTVYALLQFSIQLSAVIGYGIFVIAALIGSFSLVTVGLSVMNYGLVALCLSPPLCLLSTRLD